jgi:hypothetical protein
MELGAIDTSKYSAADMQALALAMSIDTPKKRELYQAALLNKWKDWLGDESVKLGYPKIENEKGKFTMAMLLENQLRFQRAREVEVRNGKVTLTQDTATSDEALPTKFALPIVRRAYALLINNDWSVVQPLPGPTGYVFYLDFLRESDSTNILSVEYNTFLTGELGVPSKGKLQLNRVVITALKQLMGTVFSLEAQEDARAQLGLDIEMELIQAFSTEFVRNIFGRHLKSIQLASVNQTNTGASLVAPWAGANTQHTFPDKGGATLTDYKQMIYNEIITADADFVRANRRPSTGIVCGYGLAAYLQKANTATQSQAPTNQNMASIGITDYGTYAGRWQIWGTDFLADNVGFLYVKNPDQLYAGHIYAPYVPIQVMPAIYGDYDPVTGNYQNKDAWTRNIRERSADIVTKAYAFQPLLGPPAGVGQI